MSRATGRDTALLEYYVNEGINLVLLNGRNRKPIDNEWQRKSVSLEEAEKHVRRGGGVGWQCGEASGWLAAVDNDWPEARQLAERFLPETLRGAKGAEEASHYIYHSPGLGFKTFRGPDGTEIIALKASNNGRGHQIAVPPTIHPNKGPYHFVGGYNPAAIATVNKDELRRRAGMLAATALIARNLPPSRDEGGGGRHDLALALSGYMLRNGEALEDVEEILVAAWTLRRAPREAVDDVRRSVRDTAARLGRNEPSTGGRRLGELLPKIPEKIADFLGWKRSDLREQRHHYPRTDLGNAERFVDAHRDRVLWCPARKTFLCWDGRRYAWDDRGEAIKLAHITARGIFHEAAGAETEDEQKAIAKWALAAQNESRINAMLSQSKPYLVIGMEELDRNPWLVNCQNGTLDLRTGRLKDHDPADRNTKIVPVEYDPDASCPRFKRFLQEALVDNALIRFVKRYSGYTLTGITRERLLAILYGFGKNGKTTLVELLHEVLGDYARNTDVETLLIKKYQGVGNDVAALKGARFVSAAEVEKGRRLAESKVKQLTGRDTVTARFLFGENFDFKPEFKLWLSTNNKPVIQGTDDAIWDRIRLIPFKERFEGPRADPKLPDKLREELPGVFAWMVEGCLEWQEHGLEEPEMVTEATQQYREEMDTLAAFLDDRCVIVPEANVLAEELYQKYSLWCDNNGEYKEAQKGFVARLSERGFERKRATRGVNRGRYIWCGLGLRDNNNPPKSDPKGSQREPNKAQGSQDEPRTDKPQTSSKAGASEPSEPKNHNLHYESPRDKKVTETGFTGFTGFTNEGAKTVTDLLADPPAWLRRQADKHLENPSPRTLNPLCVATAMHLYGDAERWQEVKPAMERWLKEARA